MFVYCQCYQEGCRNLKKNYHEAYNVRRKALNSFQGLKVADYHGQNIQS